MKYGIEQLVPQTSPQEAQMRTPEQHAAPSDALEKELRERKQPLRRTLVFALSAAVLAAFAVGVWQWWQYAASHEETDNAYVEGHVHLVASRIRGTVLQVLVDDNQMVKQGDVLLKLDPKDYQVEVKQQRANLELADQQAAAAVTTVVQGSASASSQALQAEGDTASAQATIHSTTSGVSATEAEVRQAEAAVKECSSRLETAQLDYQRYSVLWKERAVTKQQYDNAKMAYEVAQQQKVAADQRISQVRAILAQSHSSVQDAYARLIKARSSQMSAIAAAKQVDVQRKLVLVSAAAVERARSALERAQLDLSYTEIKSPVSGRVGRKSVEVGHMIEAGQPLLAVVEPECWVVANLKRPRLVA